MTRTRQFDREMIRQRRAMADAEEYAAHLKRIGQPGVCLLRADPPWELVLLARQLPARALDLTSSRLRSTEWLETFTAGALDGALPDPKQLLSSTPAHVAEGVKRLQATTALTESFHLRAAIAEAPLAWWKERPSRTAHYLRRALDGRLPARSAGKRAVTASDDDRCAFARFAVHLAAVTLEEFVPLRRVHGIRLRCGWLAADARLPKVVREAARRIADGASGVAADARARNTTTAMDLLADAGVHWFREALVVAGLTPADERVSLPALETRIGTLLRDGISHVRIEPKDAHQRLALFTAASCKGSRDHLRAVALDLWTSDRRLAAEIQVVLVMAILGLDLLAVDDGREPRMGHAERRALRSLAAAPPTPEPVAALLRELDRHPESLREVAFIRSYWQAADAIPPVSVPCPPPAVRAAGDESPRAGGPPGARWRLTLDEGRRRHLLLNGKRLTYGRLSRGGDMTPRHRGARLLGALLAGPVGQVDHEAVRDLRRALSSASAAELDVIRDAETYRLSAHVECAHGLGAVLRRRVPGPFD